MAPCYPRLHGQVCWNFGHIKGQVEELLRTADVATEGTASDGRGRLCQAIFDAEKMVLKTLESKETVDGAVELLGDQLLISDRISFCL
eukprot:s93_g35.t1